MLGYNVRIGVDTTRANLVEVEGRLAEVVPALAVLHRCASCPLIEDWRMVMVAAVVEDERAGTGERHEE